MAQLRARTRGADAPVRILAGHPPGSKSFDEPGKDRTPPLVGEKFPMGGEEMAGKRMPTAVVEANGRKHLSK